MFLLMKYRTNNEMSTQNSQNATKWNGKIAN